MTRRIVFALLLLSLGCRAQAPSQTEINRRITRQARAMVQIPPFVDVEIVDRKPSADFKGFDEVTLMLSYADQKQPTKFIVSTDNTKMFRVTKGDLTTDPFQKVMSQIDTTGRPVRGNKDAKVEVVVFDDFQCPYCARGHQIVTSALKTYGDRIKVIYKDFPLSEIHPWATHAAINSQCLADQSSGAYWDYTDYVHANAAQVNGQKRPVEQQEQELDNIATDIGKRHAVDLPKLQACLKEQPRKKLDASMAEAEKLGINGTPAVFVNGQRMDGAVPAGEFDAVLNAAIRDTEGAAPQTSESKAPAAPAQPATPSK